MLALQDLAQCSEHRSCGCWTGACCRCGTRVHLSDVAGLTRCRGCPPAPQPPLLRRWREALWRIGLRRRARRSRQRHDAQEHGHR